MSWTARAVHIKVSAAAGCGRPQHRAAITQSDVLDGKGSPHPAAAETLREIAPRENGAAWPRPVGDRLLQAPRVGERNHANRSGPRPLRGSLGPPLPITC